MDEEVVRRSYYQQYLCSDFFPYFRIPGADTANTKVTSEVSIDVLNNERFNKWGKPFPLSIPQQQYDSALP